MKSLEQTRMRDRILAAAEVCFERLGYEGARVEDVLREAGISRPSFYRNFKNKREVFAALGGEVGPAEPSTLDRIRTGCRRVFGERGYEGARIDDLIAASEVSRSTFYRFFESKEEAFVELDRSGVEYLRRALLRAARGGRALERLPINLRSYMEWRITARRSTVTLGEPTPAPRFELVEWKPEGGDEPEHPPTVSREMVEALICAIDQLARPPVDGDVEEAMVHRIAEAQRLLSVLRR